MTLQISYGTIFTIENKKLKIYRTIYNSAIKFNESLHNFISRSYSRRYLFVLEVVGPVWDLNRHRKRE